jgi:hypothetical protein
MKLRHRKLFVVVASALATMGIIASVAQAAPPAAPYQDFAGCPSRAENENTAYCFKYEFSGGHVQLGKRNIPITTPILFRGGLDFLTGAFLSNSESGLTPVKQTVEGGLVGNTGNKSLDEAIARSKALRVNATFESAGTPGQLSSLPLELPVKVHLENALLGSSCYVGSAASPIRLDLMTGTTNPPAPNKPITGVESGEFISEAARPEVLFSGGGIFVDNSFASPGANGCMLSIGSHHYNIDAAVNKLFGLPSAAGRNTAVLDFSLSLVSPDVAYPPAS